MSKELDLELDNENNVAVDKCNSLEQLQEYHSHKADTINPSLMNNVKFSSNKDVIPNKSDATEFKGDLNSVQPLLSPPESWVCAICCFKNGCIARICAKCANVRTTEVPMQENAISNEWYVTVKSCVDTKKLFTDDTFPLSFSSLYYVPDETKEDVERVAWVRIHNIASNGDKDLHWALFRDDLTPSDVYQGILGNCWLIGAFAVLAEREDLLRRVIVTKHMCPQGVYHLRFCKDGIWTDVLIDEFVPCNAERVPLYCQVARKQLWMPLLEKGLAKLYGCYESLCGGSFEEAISTLTGAPCELIEFPDDPSEKDMDFIWSKLLSFRESNYLMGAESHVNKFSKEEFESVGLLQCHVYSVLDIREVKGHRLVQLRSSHKSVDRKWNGDWCYESHSWDLSFELQELKKKLIPHGTEDDKFWISLKDTLKYFQKITSCKLRKNWSVVTLQELVRPLSQEAQNALKLNITETTEVDIVLHQDSQRHLIESKRSLLDLHLILSKEDNSGSHEKFKVDGCAGALLCLNSVLEPGNYVVVPIIRNHCQSEPHSRTEFKYVLNIHSSAFVDVKRTKVLFRAK